LDFHFYLPWKETEATPHHGSGDAILRKSGPAAGFKATQTRCRYFHCQFPCEGGLLIPKSLSPLLFCLFKGNSLETPWEIFN